MLRRPEAASHHSLATVAPSGGAGENGAATPVTAAMTTLLDMARSIQWCEHNCVAYNRIAVSGGRGGALYLVTALCHRGSSDSSESECGMANRVNERT